MVLPRWHAQVNKDVDTVVTHFMLEGRLQAESDDLWLAYLVTPPRVALLLTQDHWRRC
jgi:hypothetical protein